MREMPSVFHGRELRGEINCQNCGAREMHGRTQPSGKGGSNFFNR